MEFSRRTYVRIPVAETIIELSPNPEQYARGRAASGAVRKRRKLCKRTVTLGRSSATDDGERHQH